MNVVAVVLTDFTDMHRKKESVKSVESVKKLVFVSLDRIN
jgi:hypothetical protein